MNGKIFGISIMTIIVAIIAYYLGMKRLIV